jgi:16S rRNA (cytidine1402-2'-O)-methyltransferase
MLALMASGLNGQAFSFHGYLPIKESALIEKIQKIGRAVDRGNYTQIFIETPYRNESLLVQLIKHLPGHLKLCIAINLTGSTESIQTLQLAKWHKDYFKGKVPAIFLIGK